MIRIIGKIPPTVTIACSGGIDSMAFVHFLMQGKRKINLAIQFTIINNSKNFL